jgi:hypothetical protein
MSLREFFSRSQPRLGKRRTNYEYATRRLRFETFEDRRMLSFTPGVPIDTGAIAAWDTVAADLNSDGYLDVASTCRDIGKVRVMFGDGQGDFGQATFVDVGDHPWSVAVGDFNEDGKLDLATGTMGDYTSIGPSVAVLMGNGDGTFETVKSIPTGWAPKSVAVGDFNADGHLDLGVGSSDFSYYSYASVHLGDGSGNFAPKVSGGVDGIFESATAADLNGDGADDLVFADAQRQTGAHVYLGGHSSGYLQPSDVLFNGLSIEDVAVGDVNEDGALDIVTANLWQAYGISVFLNDGLGGFGTAQHHAYGFNAGNKIVLGDFTGDGHIDIVDEYVIIRRGYGDGTFSVHEYSPPLGAWSWGAAGDFNGDGWLDILGGTHETVSVLLNDGQWGQLPGDYNASGTVDMADYVVWRKTLGRGITRYTGADGSGNGVVDEEDYNVWRAHFGETLPPAVSVSDATVLEGNTGTTSAMFTVTLDRTSNVDVTVSYYTVSILAGAGSAYTPVSGSVTIPAGDTSRTFAVEVLGNRTAGGPAATFAVYLSAPTNAILGDALGIGTILDDEPRISVNTVSKSEGMNNQTTLFTFTVTLSAAYDQAVTTSYRTLDGTASQFDNDYVEKTGTLTFAPGETTKTITVVVTGDSKKEDDEYFFLNLFDNSINSLVVYSGINFGEMGTIVNDD